MPENLIELYRKFGSGYTKTFRQIAQDVLTEKATIYTAYDFFMNRLKIGT